MLDAFIGYTSRHWARPIFRRAARCFCRGLWPRRLLGTMIAAAMLTGCAVGPDFFSPDAPAVTGYLPNTRAPQAAGQSFAYGSDIPGRWWQLFHSRPLNALIETVLTHAAPDAVLVLMSQAPPGFCRAKAGPRRIPYRQPINGSRSARTATSAGQTPPFSVTAWLSLSARAMNSKEK